MLNRLVLLFLAVPMFAAAKLELPDVIGDHMVLQRDTPVCVWGWADPGRQVTVAFAGQTKTTKAGGDGAWKLKLDPLGASAEGRTLKVSSGDESIEREDVLVGEVWLCSGQSNMEWSLSRAKDAKLEAGAANHPLIRHCKMPHVVNTEPNDRIATSWTICSKDTAADYTAVGYFFGRTLHQTLRVPIGLVNDSWGGTPSEAWTRPSAMEAVDALDPLFERWAERIDAYDAEKAEKKHKEATEKWKKARDKAKEEDKPFRARAPRLETDPGKHHHRPGNIYHGMIAPVLNLTFRGAIWYQGESNQSRAHQYRTLFPLMIESWREDFDNGEFPFYFVQIANFRPRTEEPVDRSSWAEVREAQALALGKVPKTGMAVIIDIGAANNIHPLNKQDVGQRLARLALRNDYGVPVVASSPLYKSMKVDGDKVLVTMETDGASLVARDREKLTGFALAGDDKVWHWAEARIKGKDQVEVRCDEVGKPVAVRYGWADNPDVNLYNNAGLPASPFRSDDWPGMTDEAF